MLWPRIILVCMKNKVILFINKYETHFVIASLFLLLLSNCIEALSMNTNAGIIYRCIVLALFVVAAVFLIINSKNNKANYLYIFIGIYLFFSILSLSLTTIKTSVALQAIDYVLSIGEIVSTIVSFIFIYRLAEFKNINRALILKIFGYVSFILIVVSIIVDWNAIVNTFTQFDHSNYDVKSIFLDKNTFGLVLFVGSISFCYLGIMESRLYLLGALLNVFYSGIARTKTTLLICFVLLFASFVYCAFVDFKSKKTKNIIVYSTALIVCIIFILLILLRAGLFDSIYGAVFGDYGLLYDGIVVMQARFNNWSSKLMSISSPLVWIFGYGERFAYSIAGRPIDNVYIYILLNGGIIKLIIYLFVLYFIANSKIKDKRQFIEKAIFSICFLAVILYGFFEDCSLIGCSFSSLIFSLLVYCV